jgi:hypothetical protein
MLSGPSVEVSGTALLDEAALMRQDPCSVSERNRWQPTYAPGRRESRAEPACRGVVQGFFLYGFEPGGKRIEVTTGGYFVFDHDSETVTWTAEDRARGQYWGVKTVESFHTYGTPDVAGEG